MDFSTFSNDALADAGAAWFAEVEGRLSGLSRHDALALTEAAHSLMNRVRAKSVEDGDIVIQSGGGPKSS